jgi:hypothetical protein
VTAITGQHRTDGLTRTTLRIDRGFGDVAIAQAKDALQHVPGVLWASFDPLSSRMIVAHDAAVKTLRLEAASTSVGVRAAIAPATGYRRLLPFVVAAMLLVPALTATLGIGAVKGSVVSLLIASSLSTAILLVILFAGRTRA